MWADDADVGVSGAAEPLLGFLTARWAATAANTQQLSLALVLPAKCHPSISTVRLPSSVAGPTA